MQRALATPGSTSGGHVVYNGYGIDGLSPGGQIVMASGKSASLKASARLMERAWKRALLSLANVISKPTFESFIRPIQPVSLDGGVLTLGVDSVFAREWLEKRYADVICRTIEGILA